MKIHYQFLLSLILLFTPIFGQDKGLNPEELKLKSKILPSVEFNKQDLKARSLAIELSIRVQGMLTNMKQTVYQHKTEIDESKGIVKCDCSGLMCYVLRNDYPEAYLGLHGDLAEWKTRPLAVTFYQTFERAGSDGDGLWQQVPKLIDSKPGDLLAWRKKTIKKGSSTGHVCMIASEPVVDTDGMIRIRILDSNSVLHENDTRKQGETGIGAGEMWFKINEEGHPIAFTSRRHSKLITSNSILVGRLQQGKPIPKFSNPADRDLIGLGEKKAATIAKGRGLQWRVINRDNKPITVSLSRRKPTRINAVIVNGIVKRVRRG